MPALPYSMRKSGKLSLSAVWHDNKLSFSTMKVVECKTRSARDVGGLRYVNLVALSCVLHMCFFCKVWLFVKINGLLCELLLVAMIQLGQFCLLTLETQHNVKSSCRGQQDFFFDIKDFFLSVTLWLKYCQPIPFQHQFQGNLILSIFGSLISLAAAAGWGENLSLHK